MCLKIGINGFGRIGRTVFRIVETQDDIEIVGINDLIPVDQLAHLLKYDSVMGRFDSDVEVCGSALAVNGSEIPVTDKMDPAEIGWDDKGVDIVLESTGVFRTRDGIEQHFAGGAPKVLLSVPSKSPEDVDETIVLGVNSDTLSPDSRIVSNASCTTNCLAPVAKVLNDSFGIVKGLMTTIHSYTNDQNILDGPHKKDMRRARSAAVNIIPTTTGAAKAVGLVIPELSGRLNGCAMRVPTQVGSLVDLVAELDAEVTVDDVNAAMKNAADAGLKGILGYTEDPIVLTDIIGDSRSSIFDAGSTMVMEGNMVKVVSWYDNEFGYSSRCVDLFRRMA